MTSSGTSTRSSFERQPQAGPLSPGAGASAAIVKQPSFRADFIDVLKSNLELYQEVLSLSLQEKELLAAPVPYQPAALQEQRKSLLTKLERSLIALRNWRQLWQGLDASQRAALSEVKALFQGSQMLLMKILLADRDNQQALLRCGLVPASHLSGCISHPPDIVSRAYRQHAHH